MRFIAQIAGLFAARALVAQSRALWVGLMKIQLKGSPEEIERQKQIIAEISAALNGELSKIRFDANDPQDIARAIADVDASIDARLARFPTSLARPFADEAKQRVREQIQARAVELRRAQS